MQKPYQNSIRKPCQNQYESSVKIRYESPVEKTTTGLSGYETPVNFSLRVDAPPSEPNSNHILKKDVEPNRTNC